MTGQGDGVAGLIALDQAGNSLENEPVIIAIKVLGEHPIGNLVPGGGIEHQTAEHGLFGFDRMGWQAQTIAGSARPHGSITEARRGHVRSAYVA
jgi:hypothetical protein